MIKTVHSFFARQSKTSVTLISLALIPFWAISEVQTGLEVPLFYAVPIALVSWWVNRQTGIYVALLSSVALLAAAAIGSRQGGASWIFYGNFVLHGGLFVIIALVLSQLHSKFDALSELAARDLLTGLPNHRAFYDLTAREIGLKPLSLAYVDIDGLEWINHRHGYAKGDQMLCMIAQTIKQNVPRPDLVGRVGGTAFAILLPNVTSRDTGVILEKIQKELREERRKYAQPVTFCISAVACSKAPRSVAELMQEAESRMARMKGSDKDAMEIAQIDSLSALN